MHLIKFCLLVFAAVSGLPLAVAIEAPVEIEKTDTCPFCGMPIRDPRFACEVIYRDGTVIKTDEIGEMFENLPDIASNPDIAAVFVHDYYTGEWIDGRKAYYVLGGEVFTPMGYGIAAFEDLDSAERFLRERDGEEILSFTEMAARELAPGKMMMPGIPNELFLGGVVATLLITFGVVEYLERRRGARRSYPKFDLLRFRTIYALLRADAFRLIQVPVVALFFIIIAAGLFGTQVGGRNIATVLTWVIWWVALVFMIIFLGKAWCTVCPWNAVAGWIQRKSLLRTRRDLFTLNRKWPKKLRNIYPATALFIVLTWLELGYNVTYSPRYTAYLGLLILSMAVVSAVIFQRRAFCRYACLVGRVSGLYSMFAATELRRKNGEVCSAVCGAGPGEQNPGRPGLRDCREGNSRGYPCPTFEYPRVMKTNTYCILCFECVKSCSHRNIAFNIRPFAADLLTLVRTRKDEAYLALVMLSMTIFHGVTMIPEWHFFIKTLGQHTRLGYYGSFTLGMAGALALPIALYYLLCAASKLLSGNRDVPVKQIFINYAYPLLPIALFYHLAHNSMHFLTEAQKIVPVLSDPFGWGWDIFGTAGWTLKPLMSLFTVWKLQIFLVLVGHVYGIYIASKIARITFRDEDQAVRSLIPQLVVLVGFSVISLVLLAQPMLMRTSM
jgi:polyferredoxin/nitrous oxide reductase accessory protein NosL